MLEYSSLIIKCNGQGILVKSLDIRIETFNDGWHRLSLAHDLSKLSKYLVRV